MTKKDTATETTTDTPPEAAEVEEKIDELNAEAEKIDEKIDDPDTSAEERARLEERLGKIEDQISGLGDKLDQLISSPVAPSPRRTETEPPEQATAPPQSGSQTPDTEAPGEEEAPRGKSPVSKAWFGTRAYD